MNREPANRYYGALAAEYDRQRQESPAWAVEQQFVADALARLEPGAKCLDVPVGTGRFFELYKTRGLRAVGVDLSDDMLEQARRAAERLGMTPSLTRGSILALPCGTEEFDMTICVRLMSWLEPRQMDTALGELARVTRRWVLLTIPKRLRLREAVETFGVRALAQRTRIAGERAYWKVRGLPLHQRHDPGVLQRLLSRHGLVVREERLLVPHVDRRSFGLLLERQTREGGSPGAG